MNSDNLVSVFLFLPPTDYDAVRLVCSDWRDAYDRNQILLAAAYTTRTLLAPDFWSRAARRPRATSRPLASMHLELKRLHHFVGLLGPGVASAHLFYSYWKRCDRRAASRRGVDETGGSPLGSRGPS
jgi:hypothetical protein